MALLKTDELNTVQKEKNRAIPYEQYFGEMDIPEWDKKRRIEMANKFEEMMLFFFVLVEMYENDLADSMNYIVELLAVRYREELAVYIDVDSYLEEYTKQFSQEIADTTEDNLENPWYLSTDRAMVCAENEASFVAEYVNYIKALESGKKHKTWVAFVDKKTRKTHLAVNRKRIGINNLFSVGKALMRFPKDTMYGVFLEETANCRCTAKYD